VFDTNLVVVGNVLAGPEWRRVASSGALIANFKVASTARRFDRESGRWVDGNHLRVRVVAWRRLAEGIASSVAVGDPVIIYGRLYTRDWKDEQGEHRVSYEMEAYSIGHDLARGRSKFFRTKAGEGVVVEDAEADSRVGGDLSIPLTADEAPIGYGDGLPAPLGDEEEPKFLEVVAAAPAEDEPAGEETAEEEPEGEPEEDDKTEVPGDEELSLEVERLVAAQPATGRRSRRSKREPVAA
jgi:single-strand DNA-binding protein